MLKYGTGGLNIDASRVGLEGYGAGGGFKIGSGKGVAENASSIATNAKVVPPNPQGRFPANLIVDETAVEELDRQSGVAGSGSGKVKVSAGTKRGTGTWSQDAGMQKPGQVNVGIRDFGDTGGASRFFYCAKASKRDKGADNKHPTVKNTKLMEYLITMITPPGGMVLDPFMGSGSTGVAAVRLGFRFYGIEQDKQYFDIAARRVGNEESR